jgi:hypothetical protein
MNAHEQTSHLVIFWHGHASGFQIVMALFMDQNILCPIKAILFSSIKGIKDLVICRILQGLILCIT